MCRQVTVTPVTVVSALLPLLTTFTVYLTVLMPPPPRWCVFLLVIDWFIVNLHAIATTSLASTRTPHGCEIREHCSIVQAQCVVLICMCDKQAYGLHSTRQLMVSYLPVCSYSHNAVYW